LGASLHNDTTFTLVSWAGDVQLYIACTGPPTAATALWQLTISTGVLTIPANDLKTCSGSSSGAWYASVLGMDEVNVFTLTGVSSAFDTLIADARPAVDTVKANKYNYYQFHTLSTADVSFKLTPTAFHPIPHSSGGASSAVMYVSELNHPTSSRYQYSGEEVIRIAGYRSTVWYIAVLGNAVSADYSLTAYTSEQQIVSLPPGLPIVGNNTAGEYTFFQVIVPLTAKGLNITASFRTGSVDIFVACDGVAEATHFTYSRQATTGSKDNTLLLSAAQVHQCAPQQFPMWISTRANGPAVFNMLVNVI